MIQPFLFPSVLLLCIIFLPPSSLFIKIYSTKFPLLVSLMALPFTLLSESPYPKKGKHILTDRRGNTIFKHIQMNSALLMLEFIGFEENLSIRRNIASTTVVTYSLCSHHDFVLINTSLILSESHSIDADMTSK